MTEVLLAAPFYGPNLSVVESIAKRFPAASITAAQESATGTINPDAPSEVRKRVKVATCRLPGPRRPWHAKFISLTTGTNWVFVGGSPNMTKAALLSNASEGNVEAAIIRRGGDGSGLAALEELKLTSVPWARVVYSPIKTGPGAPAGPVVTWAEIAGFRLRVEIDGISAKDPACVQSVSLLLRSRSIDGLAFTVSRHEAGVLSLEVVVPKEIDADLGASVFVCVRARSSTKAAYLDIRGLVLCPEEIDSPVEFRRFRAAVRSMQRNEMQNEDMREVLTFVRNSLSGMLSTLRLSDGWRKPKRAGEDAEVPPDGPGVTLVSQEEPLGLRGLGVGGFVSLALADLPAIFRNLMQSRTEPDPHHSPNRRDDSSDGDEDEGDDDDPPIDEPSFDLDTAVDDIRTFLDWTVESFNPETSLDEASGLQQWAIRARLLEFACLLASFSYPREHEEATLNSPAFREYRNRVSSLLEVTISGAGLAWQRPTGWFLRAKQLDRSGRCALPASVVAQMLFQLDELLDTAGSPEDGRLAVSPVLRGLDLISGKAVEECDGVASALALVLTAHKQPEGRVGDVLAKIKLVRQTETAEQRALAKFGLLLQLQAATVNLQGLEKQRSAVTADPRIGSAAATRAKLLAACLRLYPQETADYCSFAARGKARSLFPVSIGDSSSCPRCRMGLPVRVAAALKNVLKLASCPSCQALIVPIPIGPETGDASQHG